MDLNVDSFYNIAAAIYILDNSYDSHLVDQSIVEFSNKCGEIFVFCVRDLTPLITEKLQHIFCPSKLVFHALPEYENIANIKKHILSMIYRNSKAKFVVLLQPNYTISFVESALKHITLTSDKPSYLVDYVDLGCKTIKRQSLFYNIQKMTDLVDFAEIGAYDCVADVAPISIEVKFKSNQLMINSNSNNVRAQLLAQELSDVQFPYNYYNLAICYQENNEFHKAKSCYEKYISTNCGLRLFEAYYNMAECSRKIGEDFSVYFNLYETSLKHQTRIEPLVRIADCYRKSGNHELAFIFSRAACELNMPTEFSFIDLYLTESYRWQLLCIYAWKKDYHLGYYAAKKALESRFSSEQDQKNMEYYKQGW